MGLETASSKILTAIGKTSLNRELALERLAWLRDAGLRVGISLMFGSMSTAGELEDGGVGYNFITLPSIRAAGKERVAARIVEASAAVQRLGTDRWDATAGVVCEKQSAVEVGSHAPWSERTTSRSLT